MSQQKRIPLVDANGRLTERGVQFREALEAAKSLGLIKAADPLVNKGPQRVEGKRKVVGY